VWTEQVCYQTLQNANSGTSMSCGKLATLNHCENDVTWPVTWHEVTARLDPVQRITDVRTTGGGDILIGRATTTTGQWTTDSDPRQSLVRSRARNQMRFPVVRTPLFHSSSEIVQYQQFYNCHMYNHRCKNFYSCHFLAADAIYCIVPPLLD